MGHTSEGVFKCYHVVL